ncbi:hypothetical protein B5X24_HaOG209646 [Helicoverpa armigera]|uniref:EFHB C-terminal EF-hand domain-containing protein n=1 Tax=Helicoverpa armigera TaxID=29058 RepID=A0A2W1BDU8_HELAM|nr:hypothetical protein B5X24_HaOG209646 [Helicoverpa armigera]
MLKCVHKTQGGKGNENRFTERGPRTLLAAGVLTAQADERVSKLLKNYRLQDEVDALIGDALNKKPDFKPTRRPPDTPDMRNRGPYTEIRNLINPPKQTKFEELVEDLKSTAYHSYWKAPHGKTRDITPFLPEGFDILSDTFGKKNVPSESAYDVITPKTPVAEIPPSKGPGYQTNRNYCKPYNPKTCFGIVCMPDKTGICAKASLKEERIVLGNGNYIPKTSHQADFQELRSSRLGTARQPNQNMDCVPPGFTFGEIKAPPEVPSWLSYCRINVGRHFLMKCLGHLNSVKKALSKRVGGLFFKGFYLYLKHLDEDKTGWVHKDVVYDYCAFKHVRVNPALIEPLLEMWNGFDGTRMRYELFIHLINFQNPMPDLPRIPDIEVSKCLDFSTTYRDMVMPGQEVDTRRRAGLPSGRYLEFDFVETTEGSCRAYRAYLPEETDTGSCIDPSTFTRYGVTHRDLYAKRSPEVVRRVFEAAGDKFTDESFNECWEKAKEYHSQGWVSFETFRRVLEGK